MNRNCETVLHIMNGLLDRAQTVTAKEIRRNVEWAANGADAKSALDRLEQNEYVNRTNGGSYSYTQKGKTEADRIREDKIREEFDKLIGRCTQSSAYLDFCKELYGYRLYLFNMMDKRQLDDLFRLLSHLAGNIILDMGCGTGSILNHIVKTFGFIGHGVDQISKEIVDRISPLITYSQIDMDMVSGENVKAETIISVDSLYFSKDMEQLIKRSMGSDVKTVCLYYSEYLFEETENKALLQKDNTRLAQVLNSLGLKYEAVDYSECEYQLYQRGLALLPKFKESFSAQKIGDIFERRLKEYKFGAELYEQGRASRFLYVIRRLEEIVNICE